MKKRKEYLVKKFNTVGLDNSETQELELLIEKGSISIDELKGLDSINESIVLDTEYLPINELDQKFYSTLSKEKRKTEKRNSIMVSEFIFGSLFGRIAFAVFCIAIGVIISNPFKNNEIEGLSFEMKNLKELIMLTLLEKESTSERLKAVSMTSEMIDVSNEVVEALFKTINNDPSTNVRLASIEALIPYLSDSTVRISLVESINKQDNPLILLRLAEIMSSIQEKRAVEHFEKALEKPGIPDDIEKEVRNNIKTINS